MLKELFEMANYEVLLAPDGGAAMKLHCANPADVVITDIIMPEKEGLETIIEFRRRFPGVKLIAISGGGKIEANEYLKTALHLGAQKAFSKPFEVIELLNAVRELLKKKHA
jgi:YesN/AraC family two-component response regulator